MRKRIQTCLNVLIKSARMPFSKNSPELATPQVLSRPKIDTAYETADEWMFETHSNLQDASRAMSRNLNSAAQTLSRLHDLVAKVAETAPTPIEARLTPVDAPVFIDRDLFDGEIAPTPPLQEAISGGH